MSTRNDHAPVRELVITRVFDAPRELVFRAWTDSTELAKWWGPRGFSNPVCEFDARPGGTIRIDMTAPDGTVFPMGGRVREVDPPARLVFTSTAFEDARGNPLLENLNAVAFEDLGARTRVTLTVHVLKSSPEVAQALAGMEQGWNESLDRLAELAKG